MIHEVNTSWKNKMAFDSQIDNHTIRIDTGGEVGDDSGPSPKKMLLASLAGCTGMDVVSLLKKMRIPFTGLEMDIDADLTDEHPKVYSEIRLIYRIFGKGLDHDKVKKAIDLSQEKYCGVSAMLKKNSPILYSIEYVEDFIRKEIN
ncbi:MAG: OsmC family protein [Flavobacteriales bacterium]|nr:OsmC family protein [Flavobacteriales bacterium]